MAHTGLRADREGLRQGDTEGTGPADSSEFGTEALDHHFLSYVIPVTAACLPHLSGSMPTLSSHFLLPKTTFLAATA